MRSLRGVWGEVLHSAKINGNWQWLLHAGHHFETNGFYRWIAAEGRDSGAVLLRFAMARMGKIGGLFD
ncbi:MAG: hypothetical protein HQM00_05080 [Magnetococcales bacterium]|nr:hypothetical protein [Magnetococcales bacterium]